MRSSVNPRPALATMYCGAGTPLAETRPANGWLRRVGDPARGIFAIRLRFPRAGPWAIAVMDLDGTFHDLGRRTVRLRSGEAGASRPAAGQSAGGSGQSAWVVLAGFVLAAMVLTGFRVRR